MSLPDLSLNRPDPVHRQHLLDWLSEWELENELRESRAAGSGESIRQDPSKAVAAAVGQIRLLHPIHACQPPLHLAVFGQPQPGRFLVAPYSRFGSPAVPGEYLTGREDLPLRVLSVCSSVLVESDRLSPGWVVGMLSTAEGADAAAMYAASLYGADTVSLFDFEGRTGAPIWHPADPRHVYLAEVAQSMSSLHSSILRYMDTGVDQLKAAEPPADWDLDN